MNRCHAHFQGDKCRLSLGHSGNHASPLHIWADGEEKIEIKLPPTRQAEKDHRKLLLLSPTLRKRFWNVYQRALKNCEDYLSDARKARRERSKRETAAS